MKPITRKEYYLDKAADTYTGPAPSPVLREDYYLATLAGDYSGNCPAPVTRLEKYMSAAAGLTTYVPQPVTRVEKYWYAIAKGTGYVPEPVTREERFLYALVPNKPGPPKPEYVDKAAEGNPILLTDSAQAPLTALTVYGHSTQDGTPSPENPVPIVSAGDSGEINVNVGGKNLIPFDQGQLEVGVPYETQGRTYTLNIDGSIIISTQDSSTSTGNIFIFGSTTNRKHYKLPPGQYSFSTFSNDVVATIQFENAEGENTYQKASNGHILTIQEGEYIAYIWLFGVSGSEWNTIIYPQIEIGKRTSYEPYKTSQTLTAHTPGGLPGIPVSSGGNYTDENGQQWICDEVDFKRGKYVQRVWRHTFDGSEEFQLYITPGVEGFYCIILPEDMNNRPGMCNQLVSFSSVTAENSVMFGANNKTVYCPKSSFYDDSLEDYGLANWKAHLAAHPLEVMTYLETPIETDLTDEEIAAYKALHTYSPTTTVNNDA